MSPMIRCRQSPVGRRLLRVLGPAVLGAAMLTSTPVTAARLSDGLEVAIDPPTSAVVLGESLDLSITVTNGGPDPTPPLVVHLDITDPDQSASVDPEDWTPTLSKSTGPIDAGDSVTVDWRIQPISAGTFAAYAVVLSPGIDSLAASNVLDIAVADRRSLDPGGILPVAIAVPGIVGLLLVVQMRAARRTTASVAAAT